MGETTEPIQEAPPEPQRGLPQILLGSALLGLLVLGISLGVTLVVAARTVGDELHIALTGFVFQLVLLTFGLATVIATLSWLAIVVTGFRRPSATKLSNSAPPTAR